MRRHWTQKAREWHSNSAGSVQNPCWLTILYGVYTIQYKNCWFILPVPFIWGLYDFIWGLYYPIYCHTPWKMGDSATWPAIRDSILGFEALQLVDGDGFSYGRVGKSYGYVWVKIQTKNSGKIDVYPPIFLISPTYPQVVDSKLYTSVHHKLIAWFYIRAVDREGTGNDETNPPASPIWHRCFSRKHVEFWRKKGSNSIWYFPLKGWIRSWPHCSPSLEW